MKEFLKLYYREIIEVVVMLVSIIICCIKKKPVKVVDTAKATLVRLLPYCITQAEKLVATSGPDKKKYCIELVYALAADVLDVDPLTLKHYQSFLEEQVEVILTTPQKKG